MAIEIGLRTLLLAQASITALAPAQTVGGVSFDAVFLDNAAEGVKPPYVIITQTGHDPYKRLDGTGGTLRKTEVDIDCYASNRPAAMTLVLLWVVRKTSTGSAKWQQVIQPFRSVLMR